MNKAETKFCRLCGQEKPISHFYMCGVRRRPECKECKNEHYRKPKKQRAWPINRVGKQETWQWTPIPEILKPCYWRGYDQL